MGRYFLSLLLCAFAAGGCANAPCYQCTAAPVVEEKIVEINECAKRVGTLLQTDACSTCATFPISLRVSGACN
jgi:hypothetical protein